MQIRLKNTHKAMLASLRVIAVMFAWFFSSIGPFAVPVRALTIVETSNVNLAAGEQKRVFVSIKNQTSYTWSGGAGKTSLYLYGNSSVLYDPSWKKADLPAYIDQSSVKPGAVATASFYVKAPSKAGTYSEMFLLGDGSTWHKNTVIKINFIVGSTGVVSAPTTQTNTTAPVVSGNRQANTSAYKAELVDKGGLEWSVDPGAHVTVSVKFKNGGNAVWQKSGTGKIEAYALDNKFKDSSWIGDYAIVPASDSVSPGGSGTFIIQLRAPNEPGLYQQSFELRVNGAETILGSSFVLPIRVKMPDSYVLNTTNNAGSAGSYAATLLLKPRESVSVSGNATVDLNYGIKNSGSAVWNKVAFRLLEVAPNLGTKLSGVAHSSWPTGNTALEAQKVTEPGTLGLYNLKIKAPAKSGNYTVRFAMVADGYDVQGGGIDIPVTVTADGYIEPDPVPTQNTTQTTTPTPTYNTGNLPPEPIIRVGIFATTDDTMMVRGVLGGFNLVQNGTTVCSFNQGEVATLKFNRSTKIYTANGPRCTSQSTNYYVAVAADGISPLEMTDFSRPVSWLPGANDNKFRAKLELRYTPKTDSVWVINELPIEYYLRGIAETSELSPIEFHKTLLIAARTYAMYHVERGTKHANEFYTVDAKYDQVYRGYGQEARSPTIVRAINETRGIVVSYQGKIAITPYFSRSDGRTRSWSEVWGGTVAWCIGVPVPQDNGKTLWGHGVGMSASGALTMTAKEGKSYDYVLKYFYTGIDLKPWYK